MTTALVLTFLWLTLGTVGQSSITGWRGIVPLKSKCEDVKRALRVEKCKLPFSEYTTQEKRVVVYFSTCRCCEGWRINRGTVTGISVHPLKSQRVSELNLGSGFVKVEDEEIKGGVRFINKTTGVTVYAINDAIMEILYYPSSSDQRLRCSNRK